MSKWRPNQLRQLSEIEHTVIAASRRPGELCPAPLKTKSTRSSVERRVPIQIKWFLFVSGLLVARRHSEWLQRCDCRDRRSACGRRRGASARQTDTILG